MDNDTPSSALAGTKRKRTAEVKFYAVRIGRAPGIYHSWNDCLEQVKGHKNAIFKSFPTLKEAEHFLKNGTALRPSGKGPQKYYAVQSGRVPGVYLDWETASKQITGWTKPKYKSFATQAEAEAFVRDGGNVEGPADATPATGSPAANGSKPPPPKKSKKKADEVDSTLLDDGDYEAGEGPLPAGTEDGFDPRIILDPATGKVQYKSDEHLNKTKWQATGPTEEGMLRVYTDGSSLGNGALGAVAGVGVYFGPNDKRNVSEALHGSRQTNQRAELTAIQRALELSPRDRQITIYSDSSYAINCVTEWFPKWRSNGWKNSTGKVVENRDLIERILNLIEEREQISRKYATDLSGKARARVHFQWVKGHKDDPGNIAADGLATAGAREAKMNGVEVKAKVICDSSVR